MVSRRLSCLPFKDRKQSKSNSEKGRIAMSKTPNKPTKKIVYKKSHMSEVKPQITKKFIEIDKRENLKESRKTPKVIRSIKPSLKEKYNKPIKVEEFIDKNKKSNSPFIQGIEDIPKDLKKGENFGNTRNIEVNFKGIIDEESSSECENFLDVKQTSKTPATYTSNGYFTYNRRINPKYRHNNFDLDNINYSSKSISPITSPKNQHLSPISPPQPSSKKLAKEYIKSIRSKPSSSLIHPP